MKKAKGPHKTPLPQLPTPSPFFFLVDLFHFLRHPDRTTAPFLHPGNPKSPFQPCKCLAKSTHPLSPMAKAKAANTQPHCNLKPPSNLKAMWRLSNPKQPLLTPRKTPVMKPASNRRHLLRW